MIYFLLGAILGILTGAITVALADETYDKKYKKGHCCLWLAKDSITKEFVCSDFKGLIQLNQYAYNAIIITAPLVEQK